MGTSDFAVHSLKALALNDNINISYVITQPDRPKGRGKKIVSTPVNIAAQKLNLNIIQTNDINNDNVLIKIEQIKPDFFVVVSFGQKLSEKVLSIPKIYPINIHASILPKYRGSSPIQASIINMDKETGVTTMVMDKNLDTGDILIISKISITETDNYEDLHYKLAVMSESLIIETIEGILKGSVMPKKQEHKQANISSILKKKDGLINWYMSGKRIRAHINAMNPWPGAFTFFNKKMIKIFKAELVDWTSGIEPGCILKYDKKGIYIATLDKTILILELMEEAGKRLKSYDYICGNKIEIGDRFDNSK